MATTKFTANTAVVAALADLPNATSGLTPAQLKAKFDESPTALKAYINDVLTVEIDAGSTAGSGALTTHKTSGDHDGRYYTETEIDANLVTKTDLTTTRKLSASGDFTGTLNGAAIVATDPGLSSLFTAHVAEYTQHVPYGGTTTGVANTYAIATPTIAALVVGMAISVKINVASTGASTLNWDGKGAIGLKKPDGTNITNLKLNGIYTFRYDGTNFIVQGEGGSGNATASDLLSGKTASTDAGDITGTMPDRAGDTAALSSAVVGTTLKLLSSDGYRDGVDDNVTITDADFIAANILDTANIFGILGTFLPTRIAVGSTTTSGTVIFTITGIGFDPKFVFLVKVSSSGNFLVHVNGLSYNLLNNLAITANANAVSSSYTSRSFIDGFSLNAPSASSGTYNYLLVG